MLPDAEKLHWARICALAGGILQLVGAFAIFLILALVFGTSLFFLPRGGDVVAILVFAFFIVALLGSLLLGGIVTYGATQLDKPNGKTWSVVLLVCGGIAFFTGAGFFIGAILAIVAGVLGLMAHEGRAATPHA